MKQLLKAKAMLKNFYQKLFVADQFLKILSSNQPKSEAFKTSVQKLKVILINA